MYSTKYPGYRVQGEIIRDGRIFVFPSPVVRSNSLQTLWSDHSAGINLIPNIHTALKETGSFSAIIKTYLQEPKLLFSHSKKGLGLLSTAEDNPFHSARFYEFVQPSAMMFINSHGAIR